MRVLLSDGSGLTARQCATRLASAGHVVEVLSPDPMCLCRFTRHVAHVRRVPGYGPDPFGWLDAALDVYRSGRFDVLFPTQEQVAVLSWAKDRLSALGVSTVVPSLAALGEVQDKVSAAATLRRLGLPQPMSATGAEKWDSFPAFVKEPIGTGSGGVRRVSSGSELQQAAGGRTVLVQAEAKGPLVMCQSVFDQGSLVAFHANERIAEGASGGASHKRSVSLPDVRRFFAVLGLDLQWHGALSADVILSDDGPVFIDINPRLVEPQNAYLSGVDLVDAMLELATGGSPTPQPDGQAGVATHQLLIAVLGAAQHGSGRRAILTELADGVRRIKDYRGSTEELTPTAGDHRTFIPLAVAATATLAEPRSWRWLASGSVSNYALSAEGWQQIVTASATARAIGAHPTPPRRRHRGGHGLALRTSRTAALMAVQRGLESTRPASQRLFEDALARHFLAIPWRLALGASRFGPARTCVEAAYDLVGGPGPRASAIARTKLIDDTVATFAQSVDQVVILGAGFDTRPYRLNCLSGHPVFEVDQPETQAAKAAALRQAGIESETVTFVPVNFEIDDLGRALLDAGYTPGHRTLFLWEGVTQYLTADAVDITLSSIHGIARTGSYVVFTYVDSAVLTEGPSQFPEADKWLRGVNKRGEPWIFGLKPADLAAFLSERGLRLVEDLTTAEAGVRYFDPLGRRDRGSGLYHVATASLIPREAVAHGM